ncbi:MAG: phosphoribosyltransferase family protein, partial [Cytophagales bacterium]
WLGHRMEKENLGRYRPDALFKLNKIRTIKRLSKAEREVELEGVYQFEHVDSTHILVIDDILTTGTTMKAIVLAIRQVLPEWKISLFTLANTDHQAILNRDIALEGNTYSWNDEDWAMNVNEPLNFTIISSL